MCNFTIGFGSIKSLNQLITFLVFGFEVNEIQLLLIDAHSGFSFATIVSIAYIIATIIHKVIVYTAVQTQSQ
mgnify:CR=1 FL=1